jgi:SNF2 family DNA or RNA helicase
MDSSRSVSGASHQLFPHRAILHSRHIGNEEARLFFFKMIIILHGAFVETGFFLWGESPLETATPDAGQKRDKPQDRHGTLDPMRERHPPSYPNNASTDALIHKLTEAGLESSDQSYSRAPLFFWMPTVGSTPLASSPLIADPPPSKRSPSLKMWSVQSLRLNSRSVIELLCRCVDKELLGPGLIVGKDLTYWTTAMRLAAGMVVRQQFLPGLVQIGGVHRARWEPVFTGGDHERLLNLAKGMPQICGAAALKPRSLPELDPATISRGFISVVVDTLLRTGVSAASDRLGSHTLGGRRSATGDHQSIHDEWLEALTSSDGLMKSDASELERLAHQIADWRRPISLTSSAPFRLSFRLEEPDAVPDSADPGPVEENTVNPSAWKLRYLLQDLADPSLLVPAELAWKGGGNKSTLFKRFDAREYLLSSLGQASALCPEIEQSLKAPAPDSCDLDSTGALAFLTEKAWLLEQAGFTILLPAWWTRKGTKARLTARAVVRSPKLKGGGGLSLEQIVDFDWQVSLGGEPLALEELQMLVNLKSPLVKHRGQWVQLNGEEIQAALGFWKKRSEGKASLRDLVKMSLGGAADGEVIEVEGVAATGWIADLLNQLTGRAAYEEQSSPGGLAATLRPYQLRGYSWMSFLRRWGLGACLADDMGLGKTVQALTLIQKEWEAGVRRPVLVICPTSVVGNWQKEAARFTPELPVMVHHGIGRRKGSTFKKEADTKALVISSYSLLHRDLEVLKEVEWSGVALDEAQNIKNPETRQSKAARSLKSDYRLALTGTPVENNVGELWSLMEFLNPGLLGTQTEFKRKFYLPIQTIRDAGATERLRRLTEPFILRRLKTDKNIISDLPDKMEMKVYCTLTKEQASLYAAVVSEATRDLEGSDGIKRKGVVLATLSKLKQVCNHPAQFLGDNSSIPNRSGKLARLTEMLAEIIDSGERALIFSQFREMGEIIRKHLQESFGREVLFLHGGVAKKNRDQMVERFQSDDRAPSAFILSLKAGGTGLNLTRANHVFHFDRWWNPAVENQATDRAFRIGQLKNVQVHKYLCLGTLEEKIDEMIENKRLVAASVVGSGEQWLTELTTEELKELFTLRREAVVE